MGGHIIPEREKVNTAVMDALIRPFSTSHTFLSLFHAKTFAVFGTDWYLNLSPLQILVGF
jgi:hypothetical protein